MKLFATSETTADISHGELECILAFEERFNNISVGIELNKIDTLGIVYVIMNPEIANPFPPGVIYRKSRLMLDVKPVIQFAAWKVSSRKERLTLLSSSARDIIMTTNKIDQSDRDKIISLLYEAASS